MKPPALIAIDLDGTLIGPTLAIESRNRAAIERAVSLGSTICLASGRMFPAARPFATALRLPGPMIVLNGAAVYDAASAARLYAVPMQPTVALQAYDRLKAAGFHIQLYFGESLYVDEINDFARTYLAISRVEPVVVDDLRALLDGAPPAEIGPMKVLAVDTPARVAEYIPKIAARLGDAALVFKSQPNFLEVTDPGANKGAALDWIARSRGLDINDIAAIGDSDNDVPMLQAAGHSFAVANATPAARAAAQRVVASQEKCGVAEALDMLTNGQAVA